MTGEHKIAVAEGQRRRRQKEAQIAKVEGWLDTLVELAEMQPPGQPRAFLEHAAGTVRDKLRKISH